MLVLVLSVALVGVTIFAFTRDQKPENQTAALPPRVTIAPSGIKYPSSWAEASSIATSEKELGVTSVATKGEPTTKVIVRESNGDLSKGLDQEKLPDQIASNLGQQVEGFKLVEKRTLKIDKHDAIKVEYTQLSPGDQKVYRYVMFIVPTTQKTYYITYSSAEDLAKISSDITTINQAIMQHIEAQQR